MVVPSGTSPTALPPSRQAEGLARWLEGRSTSAPDRSPDRIVPLRSALAREGLAILPDPLQRFPCPKVVPLRRLLSESPRGA